MKKRDPKNDIKCLLKPNKYHKKHDLKDKLYGYTDSSWKTEENSKSRSGSDRI